jgi:hypothetical protein
MRTLGDKLAKFDTTDQTVLDFNYIFDTPLKGYKHTDSVEILGITKNTTTREILINNIAIEHCFERRTTSENDYIDLGDNTITDDSDGMWDFV